MHGVEEEREDLIEKKAESGGLTSAFEPACGFFIPLNEHQNHGGEKKRP
jgi:hypothetical protein